MQSPFLTLSIDINEKPEYREEIAEVAAEFFRQRVIGIKNEKGRYEIQEFPKILYITDENNYKPDTEYYWLTEMAAHCVTRTMCPDFISAKISREITGSDFVVPSMGCRSFLSPWIDPETGQEKWWGRNNLGVVSISLPDAALAAKGSVDDFYSILDERLSIVKEAFVWRKNYLMNASVDVSPVHYKGGAILRKQDGNINEILTKRSTISLGYVGFHETIQALIGQSNTSEEGTKLSVEIVEYLREWCDRTKEEIDLSVGLYGTPSESLAGKFFEKTRNTYGIIPNVTDGKFFTNSFHVHVSEDIDALSKYEYEAKFQKASSGGFISYIEGQSMVGKENMILQLIEKAYHISRYYEFNFEIDSCYACGAQNKVRVNDDSEYECSVCGCTDMSQMSVLRRTCGYLSTKPMAKSRMQDIKARVKHM